MTVNEALLSEKNLLFYTSQWLWTPRALQEKMSKWLQLVYIITQYFTANGPVCSCLHSECIWAHLNTNHCNRIDWFYMFPFFFSSSFWTTSFISLSGKKNNSCQTEYFPLLPLILLQHMFSGGICGSKLLGPLGVFCICNPKMTLV